MPLKIIFRDFCISEVKIDNHVQFMNLKIRKIHELEFLFC
jgi:hypothetical protein